MKRSIRSIRKYWRRELNLRSDIGIHDFSLFFWFKILMICYWYIVFWHIFIHVIKFTHLYYLEKRSGTFQSYITYRLTNNFPLLWFFVDKNLFEPLQSLTYTIFYRIISFWVKRQCNYVRIKWMFRIKQKCSNSVKTNV